MNMKWSVQFVTALLLLACQDTLPNDGILESEHFTVHFRKGSPPCDGILDELEAHRTVTLKWLGIDGPARIQYYLYESFTDLQKNSPCGEHRQACTQGKTYAPEIHSADDLDEHELIHAYTVHVSVPPTALVEGLAVSMECLSQSVGRPKEDLDVVLQFAEQSLSDYDSAGYLVRYLIATYGREAFVDFYKAMDGAPSRELRGALEETFGQDADELWKAARAQDSWRISGCSCPSGQLPAGKAVEVTAGCGFLARQTFRVEGAPVRLDVLNHDQIASNLRSCFAENWYPISDGSTFFTGTYKMAEGAVSESLFALLEDGRYYMQPKNRRGGRFTLTFNETSALARECSEAEPTTLSVQQSLPSQVAIVADPALPAPYLGLSVAQPVSQFIAGSALYSLPDYICTRCGDQNCNQHSWPAGDLFFGPVSTQLYNFELAPTSED